MYSFLLQKSATCGDTDGNGTPGPTYQKCATGYEYDPAKVNNTLNATGDGNCCKLSKTCGDPDGNGTPGPLYNNCPAGFEYDVNKVANVLDANGQGNCCKVGAMFPAVAGV